MKTVIIFVIIMIFYSCTENIKSDYFDKICKDNNGFKLDSSKIRLAALMKGNDEFLSLRPLSLKSDTFFLRMEYDTDTTLKIFEYSFYKLKTSYKVYTFPIDTNSNIILFNKNLNKPENFVREFNSPDIDKRFIRQLEKNDILNLPSEIAEYQDPNFVRIYTIEYSNHCIHNIICYGEPYMTSKKFASAKPFISYLAYLKKEFDF